jgi:hypothetical protein
MKPGIRLRFAVLWAAAGAVRAAVPDAGTNAPPAVAASSSVADELHFDCRADWRGYWLGAELAPSAARLLPAVLLPPSRLYVSNLRADLRASPWEFLDLELKPRYDCSYRIWEQGARDGESAWKESGYLNGWLIQANLWDQLALAYAREEMQWGPSYLTSPSNPFRNGNSRNLPQIELPGMDFVKAIWTPDAHWSVSAMACVDDGYANPLPLAEAGVPENVRDAIAFRRAAALKTDYTAETCTFSLNGSVNQDHDPRAGAYASWNATQAILAYGEAGAGPDGDLDYLVGASYTFGDGGTLAAEFFHNGISRREQAAGLARPIAPVGPFAGSLQHDYTLWQYHKGEIFRRVDVTLRWIHAIDDGSDRLAGAVECALGDHATLVGDVVADFGSRRKEFGQLTAYIVLAGVKLSL